jgi:hypothetical protein
MPLHFPCPDLTLFSGAEMTAKVKGNARYKRKSFRVRDCTPYRMSLERQTIGWQKSLGEANAYVYQGDGYIDEEERK